MQNSLLMSSIISSSQHWQSFWSTEWFTDFGRQLAVLQSPPSLFEVIPMHITAHSPEAT